MRVHAPGFGFTVEAYVCRKRRKITHDQQGAKQIKVSKNSNFIAFPRFSISSRRNFSASVARKALERATLILAVTIFNSCWVPLSWSCRERIKESSFVEGARLSMAEEELPTVSYETGQAPEPAAEPCT
jgi:preprotein translocase subunit SecG